MFNLIGSALAVSEAEHLAHHAGDKVADAGDFSSGMMGNVGSMMGGSWGWPMMIFGWIFSILALVLLVLLIIWLIKQIQK